MSSEPILDRGNYPYAKGEKVWVHSPALPDLKGEIVGISTRIISNPYPHWLVKYIGEGGLECEATFHSNDLTPLPDETSKLGTMREEWDKVSKPLSHREPTIADTLAGIASWQREAPMDRDVLIHLKGHTITATASLLAGSTEAFTGKFLSDYTPEAASACMDAIVMQRSRTPIVFGSRDEPPLGDLPYVEDGDPPARDVFFASEEADS